MSLIVQDSKIKLSGLGQEKEHAPVSGNLIDSGTHGHEAMAATKVISTWGCGDDDYDNIDINTGLRWRPRRRHRHGAAAATTTTTSTRACGSSDADDVDAWHILCVCVCAHVRACVNYLHQICMIDD
ncbi:uncharacterized protein LOC119342895 [Triticum dicoccoides]|uniref:uncharacterized protein LOC119342895 n=1 Tax=Triticum dicoccoides TaxID=85692 RepID=UPI00188F1486|nr:uncharacterized protein LOC119342895 [Triticum dicoccoides]